MPINSQAYAVSPLVAPAQGVLQVVAIDDATLAEYFEFFLGPNFVALKPVVGDFRLQAPADVDDSDFLQFTFDDALGSVIVTTPGLGGIPPNPVDFHQSLLQTLPATQVDGTLLGSAFAALATLTGPLTGYELDLDTNIAINGQDLIGYRTILPAAYGAGTVYAMGATGGGYTFAACLGGTASGIKAAGYFADAARSVSFADGTNAITVVAGISDLSVGALLVHHYSQAGDPALASGEIAMWTDTGGGPAYYLGANIPGIGVKKIAIA